MSSKMSVNTKARQALALGRSNFCLCAHRQSVCSQGGGRERRPAGPGMETCSQARLSLSLTEASRDASDAAAGQGRCDAFRAARHQTDLCRQSSFISIQHTRA